MIEKSFSIWKTFGIILSALHLYFALSLHSKNSIGFYQHRAWTIDEGLPMNTVNTIAQTKNGYLWAGTEAGLVRFDGIKFELFNNENVPQIKNNLVVDLLVDHHGILWVGTLGGIILYDGKNFEQFKCQSNVKAEDIGDEVWCIAEASDGSIWIGSRAGLFCFQDKQLIKIQFPSPLGKHAVSKILEDRKGRIWVGTKGGGLVMVKKKDNSFDLEYMGLPGGNISALYEDRKGTIWIAVLGRGLYTYLENQIRPIDTTTNSLPDLSVHCLHEDCYGHLWAGTVSRGIKILPVGASLLTDYHGQDEFSSNNILEFFSDHEGTLWIGTGGGGLNCIRESRITTYTTENGLSYNMVYGIFQDSLGRIWVGTKGHGINYFLDGQFYTLNKTVGFTSDSILTFAEDLLGNLWCGTMGNGINRYKNGNIEAFIMPNGPAFNTFRAISVTKNGKVIAGSVNGTIFSYEKEGFRPIANIQFRVNTFLEDSQGTLWAGTFGNGLYQVNMENGEYKIFNNQAGLSNNIVACIHEDEKEEGVLWIGTAMGFNRFKDNRFSPLLKKNGLPDETAYWILEDHKKNFWVSSNRGIYCLHRKELEAFFKGEIPRVHPTIFGKEAGMRSVECNGGNHPAGWRDRDGKLWFPTTGGVSVIDPKDLGINKIPPPTVIEKIICDGQCYISNESIELPAGKNNVEIHFTALSFIVPKKILFKYKLLGHIDKWSEPRSARVVYYTDLKPGDYRFQVMACNSDGVWNTTGANLNLHIKPKWVQTIYFKASLGAIITIIVLGLIGYIKRNYQFRRLKLYKKYNENQFTIDTEQLNKLVHKLLYLFEVEKIYKNPNLTIKIIASKLLITPRILSQIINTQLKTNFFDFITEYRIKEAKRLLNNTEMQNKTVLEISNEIGYHSKSAFNRAFKNATGLTPSQFKRKISK